MPIAIYAKLQILPAPSSYREAPINLADKKEITLTQQLARSVLNQLIKRCAQADGKLSLIMMSSCASLRSFNLKLSTVRHIDPQLSYAFATS
jgi:hypothetical protein